MALIRGRVARVVRTRSSSGFLSLGLGQPHTRAAAVLGEERYAGSLESATQGLKGLPIRLALTELKKLERLLRDFCLRR